MDRLTHTQTEGTKNITSSADAGGNKRNNTIKNCNSAKRYYQQNFYMLVNRRYLVKGYTFLISDSSICTDHTSCWLAVKASMDSTPHAILNTRKTRKTLNTYTENTENYGKPRILLRKTRNTRKITGSMFSRYVFRSFPCFLCFQ